MQAGVVQPYYRGFAWTILDPSISAHVYPSYVTSFARSLDLD